MVIFRNYVNVYQRLQHHKQIPWNHHFPQVFLPRCSMYVILTYIHPLNDPNVDCRWIFQHHAAYGLWFFLWNPMKPQVFLWVFLWFFLWVFSIEPSKWRRSAAQDLPKGHLGLRHGLGLQELSELQQALVARHLGRLWKMAISMGLFHGNHRSKWRFSWEIHWFQFQWSIFQQAGCIRMYWDV